jgi:hypothetical protein
MQDIAKCQDNQCPSREKCFRYTQPSMLFQNFAEFKRSPAAVKCAHFILDKREGPYRP